MCYPATLQEVDDDDDDELSDDDEDLDEGGKSPAAEDREGLDELLMETWVYFSAFKCITLMIRECMHKDRLS